MHYIERSGLGEVDSTQSAIGADAIHRLGTTLIPNLLAMALKVGGSVQGLDSPSYNSSA